MTSTVSRRPQRLRTAALAAALAVVLAACGGGGDAGGGDGGSFADMEEVTLKVATLYGPDNWQTTPVTEYTEAVTAASEGKIKFEFFYAGSLLAPGELGDGLKDGLADLAYFVPVYTAAKYPIDDWISRLGSVPDPSPVAGTLQAAAATMDWGMNNEDYMKEFTSQGLRPLVPRLQVVHRYHLLCKQPVSSLTQLKGKRVRIGGEAWAAAAENLGMEPVALAGAEVYTGFQRGIVDCFMGGLEDMNGLKLYDIGKNFAAAGFLGFSSYGLMMSDAKWEELPTVAKQAMWDELPTYLEALYTNNFAQNKMFIQNAEQNKVQFGQVDAEADTKIEEHQSGVLANITDEAPKSVSDPKAAVDQYVAAHEKWLGIVEDELGYSAEGTSWPELLEKQPDPDVDLAKWAERVHKEVFEPKRPS